jgi:hypothetical protein
MTSAAVGTSTSLELTPAPATQLEAIVQDRIIQPQCGQDFYCKSTSMMFVEQLFNQELLNPFRDLMTSRGTEARARVIDTHHLGLTNEAGFREQADALLRAFPRLVEEIYRYDARVFDSPVPAENAIPVKVFRLGDELYLLTEKSAEEDARFCELMMRMAELRDQLLPLHNETVREAEWVATRREAINWLADQYIGFLKQEVEFGRTISTRPTLPGFVSFLNGYLSGSDPQTLPPEYPNGRELNNYLIPAVEKRIQMMGAEHSLDKRRLFTFARVVVNIEGPNLSSEAIMEALASADQSIGRAKISGSEIIIDLVEGASHERRKAAQEKLLQRNRRFHFMKLLRSNFVAEEDEGRRRLFGEHLKAVEQRDPSLSNDYLTVRRFHVVAQEAVSQIVKSWRNLLFGHAVVLNVENFGSYNNGGDPARADALLAKIVKTATEIFSNDPRMRHHLLSAVRVNGGAVMFFLPFKPKAMDLKSLYGRVNDILITNEDAEGPIGVDAFKKMGAAYYKKQKFSDFTKTTTGYTPIPIRDRAFPLVRVDYHTFPKAGYKTVKDLIAGIESMAPKWSGTQQMLSTSHRELLNRVPMLRF